MDYSMNDSESQRKRTERGRKGGQALLQRYGREHFIAMGRRGGRPTWREALLRAEARAAETRTKRGRPRKPPPATAAEDQQEPG